MFAISDGGSSKADWKVVSPEGQVSSLTTTGFNPNYAGVSEIENILRDELLPGIPGAHLSEINYYGAGCWDQSRRKVVSSALQSVFPLAKIHIDHDLLAASRATCWDQPGIACILGTGSNSMLYDGKNEVDNVTNLGFLLGDEGSGSHIGKELVKAYFYREMPPELTPIMKQAFKKGRIEILDRIYAKGIPAAYLASFTQLFSKQKEHPFVKQLIKDCFVEFLRRHVCKYDGHQNLSVSFVGSIAFHFKEILSDALSEMGLKEGVILKKPIEKLLEYHLAFHCQKQNVNLQKS